jgi:uncharacterized lipoprotein
MGVSNEVERDDNEGLRVRAARRLLWLAPLLLALAGCHMLGASACHGAQPYMSAKSVAPLKIPPGLDSPETGNALRIPALNEPAPPPRKGRQPCLDEPPPFKARPAAPAT